MDTPRPAPYVGWETKFPFCDNTLIVTHETTARQVPEWDSGSNVELMIALEIEFRVRFSTGEIVALKNVGELVDAITERMRDAGR